jgi:A/G-specific adenine glycosylase
MKKKNNSIATPFSKKQILDFRKMVYNHFKQYGRTTLPWRTDYNPYHILVSEIMLQQTQVDRVIGKFTAFIERFPAVVDLADAPLDEVLNQWQGLGYNRRAKALREAAIKIVEQFECTLPDNPESLRTLPGIGPATASSIAAFAFNKPTLFLETNIRTVYIHHFFNDQKSVDDGAILPVADAMLDRRNPRKWYSALMDYGSMLKKEVGNLTRNSVTYKKQSPFIGSRRQVRGAVLRFLLEKGPAGAVAVVNGIQKDKVVVDTVLHQLLSEGLLTKEGRRFRVAR